MVKTILAIIIILVFAIPMTANATMALAWDQYTDTTATDLRLESSTDNSSFSTLVDNIATDAIGVGVADHTSDNERVYYRLIAYNADYESIPSNVVSYYWSSGGSGQIGLPPPGDINFVDCSNPTAGAQTDFCNALNLN